MLRIFRILSENLVNKKMKSKFRQILFILSLSFTVMAADEAMNVLFIIVDDLRPELGCYGVNYIQTPNIDKLASSGAIFKNAFVQQAVCSASRASFLTGLRPDSTGSDYPYSIYTVENLFEGDRPSIMRHFMRQGYYVRSIGKIHHGYNEDFSEKSFSSGYGTRYADTSMNYAEKAEKIPFERGLVDDQYYDDGKNTIEAISTLHRMAKQDKPFFSDGIFGSLICLGMHLQNIGIYIIFKIFPWHIIRSIRKIHHYSPLIIVIFKNINLKNHPIIYWLAIQDLRRN